MRGGLGANASGLLHVNPALNNFQCNRNMHEQRFVSTSVDPFTKKLYDRPINGKYVLIERLGKGGFGVVYLGTCLACALQTQH